MAKRRSVIDCDDCFMPPYPGDPEDRCALCIDGGKVRRDVEAVAPIGRGTLASTLAPLPKGRHTRRRRRAHQEAEARERGLL